MSAERPMSMADPDLEAALRDLGAVLALPAAREELAGRVRVRIEAERPRRAAASAWWHGLRLAGPAGRPFRRSVLLAAAALLVAAAAVTAAIGFALPGISILFGGTPPPAASATASPASNAPGALLGLGTSMSLEEAKAFLDFDVLVPPHPIGPPDAVYVQGRRVTLVWGPGEEVPGTANATIGLVLIELRATIDKGHIEKLIFSGTAVETVEVDGAPGYWISGERHEIAYVAPNGDRIPDTTRVAGNTLLWTEAGITYRLEGELSRDEALALAASLR